MGPRQGQLGHAERASSLHAWRGWEGRAATVRARPPARPPACVRVQEEGFLSSSEVSSYLEVLRAEGAGGGGAAAAGAAGEGAAAGGAVTLEWQGQSIPVRNDRLRAAVQQVCARTCFGRRVRQFVPRCAFTTPFSQCVCVCVCVCAQAQRVEGEVSSLMEVDEGAAAPAGPSSSSSSSSRASLYERLIKALHEARNVAKLAVRASTGGFGCVWGEGDGGCFLGALKERAAPLSRPSTHRLSACLRLRARSP